jgi:surface carbohydrate biosynthesis protein (TIGR04326 family)
MTADDAMSAFWLGAIGERVLGKVPEFLLVAQVRAIHRHMIGTAYRTCVLAMDDLLARRVLTDLMRAHGSTVWLTSTESRRTAGGSLRRLLERPGRAAAAGKAIAVWLRCCLWGLLARKLTLQPDAWRSESEPLLFMSYFPYVDRAAAARGQFRNRYALPLQDLLRKEAQPVWWACHFVFIDGFGFRDAVTLCRKFVTHGERIAMVEGYFKPAAAWRALRAWVKLTWRARGIEKELGSAICEGLLPTSARALARQLWVRSYEGPDLMHGLCSYEIFANLIDDCTSATTALYYCEFQNWEHALNAVIHTRSRRLRSIAFQHATLSRVAAYERPPSEAEGRGEASDLPVPDVLCAAGERIRERLSRSAYRGLCVVESVRYLSLSKHLAATASMRRSAPVLLVAPGLFEREVTALLSLVMATYPRADGIRILLRGHPSLPLEPAIRQCRLDMKQARYEHANGDLNDVLAQASHVLVASSTVAIESLAFGCEVLTAEFPSFVSNSTLDGFEHFHTRVYGPHDIRTCVDDYVKNGPRLSIDEKRNFVRQYWCLDEGLPRWRAVLGMLPIGATALGAAE